MPCSVDPADCDGNLRNVTNECCLICEVSVDDNTTTTVRTPTTSTRVPVLGCQIGTDIYSIGKSTYLPTFPPTYLWNKQPQQSIIHRENMQMRVYSALHTINRI